VFAGWSFERLSSGSGDGRLAPADGLLWRRSSGSGDGRLVLDDGRLVLTTVLCWLPSGASLGREDVRKEGRVKNKVAY